MDVQSVLERLHIHPATQLSFVLRLHFRAAICDRIAQLYRVTTPDVRSKAAHRHIASRTISTCRARWKWRTTASVSGHEWSRPQRYVRTRINWWIAPRWRIARWWSRRWTRRSPLNRFVAERVSPTIDLK